MHFEELTEKDLFGRFFLKAPDGERFIGYYKSLDALRPLIGSETWLNNVTGFYINVAGDYNAVRLSFFTTAPDRTKAIVDGFVIDHNLKQVADPEEPHCLRVSEPYGNEELRFRKFLATYTQIGLDIMKADLLHARCLFATFRWQVMRARKPYKAHFSKTFEDQSSFYNSLSKCEKENFWSALSNWPNPPQVDWAHLFVNMVLGCDWRIGDFLKQLSPLSIPSINLLIKEQGFQIPENWHP